MPTSICSFIAANAAAPAPATGISISQINAAIAAIELREGRPFWESRIAEHADDESDDESDDELCWDCDEQVATHGHFCGDCNLEPIMFRDPNLVKAGVCRICAEDDDRREAFGSYGEDNIPMCLVCKELGCFNSDGTKKSPGNDDDDCPGCLSADCEECKAAK